MYIPNAFQKQDLPSLLAFMRAHSFATLVTVVEGVPVASHVPLVIDERAGELWLSGHLAKANPQWQAFAAAPSVAIFTGPHAYISPTNYEKVESVPTWNYIAVHATGPVEVLSLDSARDAVLAQMHAMMRTFEASYEDQWNSLSERYRDGMLRGIVAFQMRVERLEGKYKLGQNRSEHDRRAVAQALLNSPDAAERATGEAMLAEFAE